MLDRVDRVQILVADRATAAETYNRLLGAEIVREAPCRVLAARRTVMALGESEIELCEPEGSGLAADLLMQQGEGLITAGVSTGRSAELKAHIAGLGIPVHESGDQFYIDPEPGFGMRFVVSPSRPRPRVGPVSFLYEVTNTLVSDWRLAAAFYAGLFALRPEGFADIGSPRFGYQGTLTLFNPPDRLDRIELSQVTDPNSAMGRWTGKRGDSLYMCYCEVHDLKNVIARLDAAGARWTPRGATQAGERDGLWVHPGALHGLLLGVSRTTLAWEWSGRPQLVAADAGWSGGA
jgi:hypothetical protein